VDRIVVHSVGPEHIGEFLPNRIVPPCVFGLKTGMYGHDEGFSDHEAKGYYSLITRECGEGNLGAILDPIHGNE
jgi:hypothetical protein